MFRSDLGCKDSHAQGLIPRCARLGGTRLARPGAVVATPWSELPGYVCPSTYADGLVRRASARSGRCVFAAIQMFYSDLGARTPVVQSLCRLSVCPVALCDLVLPIRPGMNSGANSDGNPLEVGLIRKGRRKGLTEAGSVCKSSCFGVQRLSSLLCGVFPCQGRIEIHPHFSVTGRERVLAEARGTPSALHKRCASAVG